jgi:preprotein translocase subunit SecY
VANKPASASGSWFNLSLLSQSWETAGLRQSFLFTLGALAVFRLGAQIPIWGVNAIALKQLASNQLLGFLDMFSGGALGSLSILALGIGPYITSSIIIQLLTVVIPRLEEMQKEEGEAGRRKIAQMTRYATVVLALFQAFVVIRLFTMTPGVLLPGVEPVLFYTLATVSLVAGSLFTLWLSELITERGIGNGGSLLIFVGILASLPFYATQTAQLVAGDPQRSFNLVLLLAIYLVSIVFIIILQEAVRKIFIVNAKRQVGNKIYGGQSSFIPFKINPAGVMPIIFAFAMLAFPQTIIQLVSKMQVPTLVTQLIEWYTVTLGPGKPLYLVLEFTLIVFFTFFYASIVPSMQPKEIALQLKKYGSSIPGIKPGKPTSDVLEVVISRIMWIGAIGLALITLLASSATSITGITTLSGLGSTALIIMVGVALDTVNQIRVHLLSKQYEGFLKS